YVVLLLCVHTGVAETVLVGHDTLLGCNHLLPVLLAGSVDAVVFIGSSSGLGALALGGALDRSGRLRAISAAESLQVVFAHLHPSHLARCLGVAGGAHDILNGVPIADAESRVVLLHDAHGEYENVFGTPAAVALTVVGVVGSHLGDYRRYVEISARTQAQMTIDICNVGSSAQLWLV
ncbi:hypothetical protein BX600DRAFT_215690, partial [Xylariales sp. PMI_506]